MPLLKRKAATPSSENLRRAPTQERAQRTIEAIFEATAQIVEHEGEGALTTNKVAQKAGFSIGTLYQYFPSKEAIVLAMSQRERERFMAAMQAALDKAVREKLDARAAIREVVRLLLDSFANGPRLRRTKVRMVWRMAHYDPITQSRREAAERQAMALATLGDPRLRPPNPAMMFVVTRAVMGAIRNASLEDSPLLGTREFEDELVRLVWGLFRSD
jgi:AcrR family transcriptional regulator